MAKSPNSESSSPTIDIIENCKIDLCLEKVAAQSQADAKCIDYDRGKINKQSKICCLVKAEETNKEYWNLDFYYGISSIKESSLIKGKITELEEKNTKFINLFKDTVKTIKNVKTKMDAACEEACKLDRCIDEEKTCNPELYDRLSKIPGIWENVNNIKDHADSCCSKINETFTSAVEISGIITFSNIQSLSPLADNLDKLMGELRKDIDQNVSYSKSEIEKSQLELIDSINSLTEIKYEKCDAITDTVSACHILDFICDPNCENCDRSLDCLCGETPTYPGGDDKDPCEDPCGEGSKGRKGPKGDKKAWDM